MRHSRVVVSHYGGPEELQLLDEDCPEPKAGEVRVRVLAAGVSLPDVMAREGVHPETPQVPFTPGWEFAGVVDRLGAGVSGVDIGQLVAALPIHGAYAEFVCLAQRELIPVPAGVDAAEAASLPRPRSRGSERRNDAPGGPDAAPAARLPRGVSWASRGVRR